MGLMLRVSFRKNLIIEVLFVDEIHMTNVQIFLILILNLIWGSLVRSKR